MEVEARRGDAVVIGLVISGGLVLSFLSGLTPHFTAGYRLDFAVIFAGLLPYIVYGSAAPVLARAIGSVSGMLLLLAHVALVAGVRLAHIGDHSNSMLIYFPVLLAVLMLPLVFLAQRQPY